MSDATPEFRRGNAKSLTQEQLREAAKIKPPDYGRRFYMELVLTMCSHLPDEDWEQVKRRRASQRSSRESS